MHKINPADELADIRAEISRLKSREADLRAQFLADPDTITTGRWARVEVVMTRTRVFDKTLLPSAITNDPRYWRERVTEVVRSLPAIPRQAPRPGWPIQRDTQSAMH